MIALKFVSAAALLTLAAGCQSSGSADSSGHSRWARHEAISRTYVHGTIVQSSDNWSALANNDSSRTYTNGSPLEADDLSLRENNDDTSRTYHYSGPTTINEHGTYVGEANAKHSTSDGVPNGPASDGSGSAKARH